MKKRTMIDQLKELPPHLAGFLLAVFIAAIRVIYDRQETTVIRTLLEAALCGALAVTAGTAVNALGLNESWTLFAGGMIGFMGSESIKAFAERFIVKRI